MDIFWNYTLIFKPFFKGKGHQTTPNLQPAGPGITIRLAFYPKPAQQVNSKSGVTSQRTQQLSLALTQQDNKLHTIERHNSAYNAY